MNQTIYYWLIGGAVAVWFFFRENFGETTIYQLEFLYMWIAIGILFYLALMFYFKEKTPHIVSPSQWNSFTVEPMIIGEWVCIQVGGIKLFGTEGDGMWILPKNYFKYNMHTYFTPCRLDKVHYMQAPLETQNYISERKVDINKIYVGFNLWEQEVKDPKIAVQAVSQRLDEHNQNFAVETVQAIGESIEALNSMSEETMKRFNNNSIIDATKDAIRKTGGEQNPPQQ